MASFSVGRSARQSVAWTGLLAGIGAADEIVLRHQLQWHNVYFRLEQSWPIVSDRLFDIFTVDVPLFGVLRL